MMVCVEVPDWVVRRFRRLYPGEDLEKLLAAALEAYAIKHLHAGDVIQEA